MSTIPDLRTPDEVAVRASIELVKSARPEDLDRPTPCAGWDLADLLAHMTAQHHGFAASAGGGGASLDQWLVRPLGADPVAEYAEASERVIAAFAPDDVLTRKFALPEFGEGVRVPGRQAISFHFIDYPWCTAGTSPDRSGCRSTHPTNCYDSRSRSPRRCPTASGGWSPVPPSRHGGPRRTTPSHWHGSSPCWDAPPPGRRVEARSTAPETTYPATR